MKIRKTSEEDVKAITRVYVDGWKTTYRGLVPEDYLAGLSYEEAEQRWENFLKTENDNFIHIAISDEGKVYEYFDNIKHST